jgi:hypothetical protein
MLKVFVCSLWDMRSSQWWLSELWFGHVMLCNSKDGSQCLRGIYYFYLVKFGSSRFYKDDVPCLPMNVFMMCAWLKHKTFEKLAVLVILGKTKIQLVWNVSSPRTEAIFGFYLIVEAKPWSKTLCFWLEICWWERFNVLYYFFIPLNAKLNPICHLLALLGAHHILHISRIRVDVADCMTVWYE